MAEAQPPRHPHRVDRRHDCDPTGIDYAIRARRPIRAVRLTLAHRGPITEGARTLSKDETAEQTAEGPSTGMRPRRRRPSSWRRRTDGEGSPGPDRSGVMTQGRSHGHPGRSPGGRRVPAQEGLADAQKRAAVTRRKVSGSYIHPPRATGRAHRGNCETDFGRRRSVSRSSCAISPCTWPAANPSYVSATRCRRRGWRRRARDLPRADGGPESRPS